MTGVFLQEVLRQLNCMDEEEFRECWPKNGTYLWDKFLGKGQDVFEFICYLDPGNAQRLINYVITKAPPEVLFWSQEGYDAMIEALRPKE